MTDAMSEKKLIAELRERAARSLEIRQAVAASPGMEIGAAYKKWKAAQGTTAKMLISAEQNLLKKELTELQTRFRDRPCTREGCDGTQRLESVCNGCIEGQAGYKTKWTCRKCMHRDLSKESIEEWLIKLSSP